MTTLVSSRSLRFGVVSALVLALVVLVSRASALPNDVTADFTLGQLNFTSAGPGLSASKLYYPSGIAVDNLNNVYVVDSQNNRVLEFDDPLNTDAIADRVFGQAGNLNSGVCNLGGITASSLCYPLDVAVDSSRNVYIVDWQNNRVLEYYAPLTTDLIADRVFGQSNSFTTGTYATAPTANTLNNPVSVAVDNAFRVYIGDRGMYRVLEYDPPIDTTADRVFGQFGSFTSNAYNNGGTSANSLSAVLGIGVDGVGNLYVADQDNARALMYKTPVTTDTTADLVFGQYGNFTTNSPNNPGVNADTLDVPTDIEADAAGNVYITDTGAERTLEYDDPVAQGTTADVVFGMQGNMTNYGNNFGGLGPDSQADPWAIDFDTNCNLWIVDYGNNRILEYDKPPHACIDAPSVTPTPSPVPTGPVLTTAPGTVSVSFNGGTAHAKGVTITFGTINIAGNTTMSTGSSGPPVPPPPGFDVMGFHNHGAIGVGEPTDPVYYEISTTAGLSGLHTVCMAYDASDLSPGNHPHLMHFAVGGWTDITTTTNVAGEVICGATTSFSPFAVMQSANAPAPVGGAVDVSATPVNANDHTWLWILLTLVAAVIAGAGGLGYARREI